MLRIGHGNAPGDGMKIPGTSLEEGEPTLFPEPFGFAVEALPQDLPLPPGHPDHHPATGGAGGPAGHEVLHALSHPVHNAVDLPHHFQRGALLHTALLLDQPLGDC